MSTKKLIYQQIDKLSDNEQKKVLDFIMSLEPNKLQTENEVWSQFSLEQAMKDIENDELPEYTEADIIEIWQ